MRAGFSRKDDTLPERILNQPLPDGPAKGMVWRLDAMLPDSYRCRGWDEKGRPTLEKLREWWQRRDRQKPDAGADPQGSG